MTIDVDSTICEVHGHHNGGAAYGSTRQLGYHPLLATRADTGEVLHIRMRKGSANSARGCVRRAGAAGELALRADSGFWSAKIMTAAGGTAQAGPDLEYRLGEYLGMANQQA